MNAAVILNAYKVRDRVFGRMPEPQWRILLDLAVNGSCRIQSACVGSGWPETTALRHIVALERKGLVWRVAAADDRRGAFINLTTTARNMFADLEERAAA